MMKMVVFVMMMFVAFEEFLLGRFVVKQVYVSQICRGQFVVAKNVTNTYQRRSRCKKLHHHRLLQTTVASSTIIFLIAQLNLL